VWVPVGNGAYAWAPAEGGQPASVYMPGPPGYTFPAAHGAAPAPFSGFPPKVVFAAAPYPAPVPPYPASIPPPAACAVAAGGFPAPLAPPVPQAVAPAAALALHIPPLRAPASFTTTNGGFSKGAKARFEEIQREYDGLCEIAQQAHVEGSSILQLALRQIEACRKKGLRVRAGLSISWHMADILEEGEGDFSEGEREEMMEACKLRDSKQKLMEQGRGSSSGTGAGAKRRRVGGGFEAPAAPAMGGCGLQALAGQGQLVPIGAGPVGVVGPAGVAGGWPQGQGALGWGVPLPRAGEWQLGGAPVPKAAPAAKGPCWKCGNYGHYADRCPGK
jgi:hypothetical protein